ncbi:hypothetical protein NQZ79_g4828 [Umbelopsis isabellina]|nr:hypothetical protein NQZ79_g4828 [Umbelopsis isabellina]
MSKGRLGTTGTSYLGVGGKRANQPNPELVKLKNEIEELQLEKEESRKNLLHFISELDEANRKNKELEKQMTELKASDKDSQQQDSSTAGKNGSLEDSVENHDANQSNLRQIEEQLSVALKENQDLKQESEKQVKAREESKRRLEEQIESMKEVNASLKSKIDSLESQIQSGTGYQTANVEQHSEEQNQKFDEDLKSMQEKATMLEEQLNETKSRLDQAYTNAEQNAAERDHVKDSLMNLKLQIETVNKDKEAKDRKINSLEATLEQHKTSENDKKRLEELSETVATLEAEIKQIQSADQEKSHKINELEEALQENNAVTKEKEQLLVKIESAEAALEQAKKADEEKASKINALETSLQESKSADQAREQLVEKIAAVEMALEEIKHADEAKAGEIKSLKASLEKSESIAQEKDLLTEKVASLEANLKKSLGAEADRQQLVEKITSLESALKQAEESALDKNKLTDRITSLETALEKSKESEKEKDELNERIATLQTSLEKMRSSEKDDKRKGNTKESELSKKLTNLQKKLDNTNQERQNAEKNSAKKITKLQEQKKAAEEQANEKHKEIVNLNHNNAQLLSDKQNVENEYEDLKAKHETLISQLTEAKSRLEVFDQRGQEAEKLQSDLSELHKVIDELKISRQADKDAAEVKQRDILADVEKHLEKIAELEEVELDLRNKLQNSEATSESTEALFAEARKQRDELSAWKTEHEALQLQQKDNHDATYQELSAKIEELNDLVTKHKDSEQSASQLISSLEGKVLSAESIAKEQETQYRKISESLEIAKETLNQKDAHIVELENNLKSVDERLELVTQRAHKLEKEKSNLAEEIVAYKSQLSELTSQLVTIQQDAQAAVKQHAEKLNAQKEEHNNNLKALESKLAKAVSIESDLHQTITDLRAELKSGQDQSEASKLAIDELKKQLDEASSALIAAESDAKGLRDEVEAAKGASSQTISDLEIAKEDALHKVQEIERRLEETKKNADRLETEKASLSHTLQGSLDEARKEIDTLKSEAANSSKQAEEHLELIHHLQQELESAKSKSDKAAADMEQIVRENQSAKERMESAEIELKNMKGENEKLLNEAKYHHKTIEDVKGREGHLRLLNKTLQDEIRKLSRPNSAASTQISPASRSETHIASDSSSPSDRMSFSIPRKLSSGGTPPEVNTEYLKNIMIKFIEDKRTRSQLIPVLATMLNFTPEETHRLQSKV